MKEPTIAELLQNRCETYKGDLKRDYFDGKESDNAYKDCLFHG